MGAAAYYDARVDCAERLALENVLDAEGHGARVFNYCEALRIEKESNTQIAATLRVRDVLDGDETQFGAKVAVNATGAWVDPVAATLTGRQPYAIRTTKGIRLVCKPLTQRALVLFSRLDQRPCLRSHGRD